MQSDTHKSVLPHHWRLALLERVERIGAHILPIARFTTGPDDAGLRLVERAQTEMDEASFA